MEESNQEILDKLNKIQIDIQFIRESIEDDGELTDWAKKELAEARATPESECVSHEEVKEMLIRK